jgi:hypothetical protein
MKLSSNNYEFWAQIDEETSSEVEIAIGNPRGRPKPCIRFTVFRNEVVLQDVMYYSTCSSHRQLERGSGTVEMLQAALKAIMTKYPRRPAVVLNDKSHRPDPRLGNVPLPELLMFMNGKTWYQDHLGAVPNGRDTRRVLRKYLEKRDWPLSRLQSSAPSNVTVAEYVRRHHRNLTESDLHNIRMALHLETMSGRLWKIDRSVVMAYPVSGVFEDGQVGGGGRMVRSKKSKPYYPHACPVEALKLLPC